MRVRAKVTSKGQVIEVRHALNIATGDILVFEVGEGYATVAKRRSAIDIAAELREKNPRLSQPSRYATKEEAIESHFREQVVLDDSAGRHDSQLHVVGRESSERSCPDESS
jgi:bifunctional DNA-binding transcriptional regulator/antitoxin component of YhaV-PrlF toxin-antitoxin module